MTLIQPTRRAFIASAIGLLAAPMVVKASSIMPVRALEPLYGYGPEIRFIEHGGRVIAMNGRHRTTGQIWSLFVNCHASEDQFIPQWTPDEFARALGWDSQHG